MLIFITLVHLFLNVTFMQVSYYYLVSIAFSSFFNLIFKATKNPSTSQLVGRATTNLMREKSEKFFYGLEYFLESKSELKARSFREDIVQETTKKVKMIQEKMKASQSR